MQKFIKIYLKVLGIGPVSLFSEFEPRQNLYISQISFGSLSLLHLVNINVYAKFHHNILHSSRDRAIFTFSEFGARQSLDRRNMSVRNLFGAIMSISMFTQKFIIIFHSVQKIGSFSFFFRIWHSAKPRPMINVILQFLGLDLFNNKLSAKCYQNIPNGLIVNFHFFFRI